MGGGVGAHITRVSSYSLPDNQQPRTRAERADRNHQQKSELIQKGSAHGILVYDGREPIGWCQYGPREELPCVDNRQNYRRLLIEGREGRFWRTTCFVVDKQHRRRGVAAVALRAALEAIKKKGGGLVEAYPVSKTDQGLNNIYCGTVSMFKKAGFKTIAPLAIGRTATVVMRMTI